MTTTRTSGAFKINQTEQLAGRAARTEKAIERLDVVDKPREPWQLRLVVASTGRSGDVVVRLDDAVVERGGFRLGPIDIEIGYGERVAVVGANGSGKTTLLDALLGRQPLADGAPLVRADGRGRGDRAGSRSADRRGRRCCGRSSTRRA